MSANLCSWVLFQWSSKCYHTCNSGDEMFMAFRLAVLSDMLIVFDDSCSRVVDGNIEMWHYMLVVDEEHE